MSSLHHSYFFNLSEFAHHSLFDGTTYVWEALAKISSYLQQQELGKIEGEISPQAYLINPESISVGKGTIVEPGAYIKGPCIIGENCSVRHGAYVRGNLIAGNECIIGHDSEMKNVILLNHAYAGHFAYVGDSILGNYTNLGAGTKCANLKLNNGTVCVRFEGKKIETNLRKFGAIVGDHSQTGCNSVSNPGTLMGKGVHCYPCVNFGGFIPSHHQVKMNQSPVLSVIG